MDELGLKRWRKLFLSDYLQDLEGTPGVQVEMVDWEGETVHQWLEDRLGSIRPLFPS